MFVSMYVGVCIFLSPIYSHTNFLFHAPLIAVFTISGSLVLSGRDVVRCLGMGYRIAEFDASLDCTGCVTVAADEGVGVIVAADEGTDEEGEEEEGGEEEGEGKEGGLNLLMRHCIQLDAVTVCVPCHPYTPLIQNLSMVIKPGQSILVST